MKSRIGAGTLANLGQRANRMSRPLARVQRPARAVATTALVPARRDRANDWQLPNTCNSACSSRVCVVALNHGSTGARSAVASEHTLISSAHQPARVRFDRNVRAPLWRTFGNHGTYGRDGERRRRPMPRAFHSAAHAGSRPNHERPHSPTGNHTSARSATSNSGQGNRQDTKALPAGRYFPATQALCVAMFLALKRRRPNVNYLSSAPGRSTVSGHD